MLCPLSFTAQLLATCTFRVECAEVIAKRWVSDSVKCKDIKNMVIALLFFFFFLLPFVLAFPALMSNILLWMDRIFIDT